MYHSLHAAAARNNAEWCDIVCQAQGTKGMFYDDVWANLGQVPQFYPNVITLQPDVSPRRINEIISSPSHAFSIKDSFNTLNLSTLNFSKLFDAQWLAAPQITAMPQSNGAIVWKKIDSIDSLQAWESAWAGSEPSHIFNQSVASHPAVCFLAAYDGSHIIAGAILTKGEHVVGVSNIFFPVGQSLYFWQSLLYLTQRDFPSLPIVGYESGDDLEHALSAGLRPIGALSIWVNASPHSK